MSPVCQSLQWIISGLKLSFLVASNTALQKYTNRWRLSESNFPPQFFDEYVLYGHAVTFVNAELTYLDDRLVKTTLTHLENPIFWKCVLYWFWAKSRKVQVFLVLKNVWDQFLFQNQSLNNNFLNCSWRLWTQNEFVCTYVNNW